MQALATILRVEHGRAWLKVTDGGGGCGRCDEPGGCRSVQITQAFGLPRGEFALPPAPGIKAGDRVVITIPEGAPLRAALASYGLGVLLLLGGAALGSLIGGGSDLLAAIGGGAGLGLAVLINRLLVRSRNWRAHLRMELAPESACLHSLQES